MLFANYVNNLQDTINEENEEVIPGGMSTYFVTVPEFITVHLGSPDDETAENVTVAFSDYIKNVASSELYPTWPESALEANIHAIISVTLNRVVLEWYKARGYNFDITNSPQYDQAYFANIGVYENISNIVNEIFTQYIVRDEQVIPLFAEFCDGRISQCDGLHQWGSVDLANEGYTAEEILKYYYGDDVTIVTGIPEDLGTGLGYPGEPIELGNSGIIVLREQLKLNRIFQNYPLIPQIEPSDGYFGQSTELAVLAFQDIFNLPETGIIDRATFYEIRRIYTAISRLSELTAESSIYDEIYEITSGTLLEGDIRPRVAIMQYILDVLSLFYKNIIPVAYTGIFDEPTTQGVIEFQKVMGLPATGIVDYETWSLLFNTAIGVLDTIPPETTYLPYVRYPGVDYERSENEEPGVFIIQVMLSYISLVIESIPPVDINGVFDDETERAVIAFQTEFGLNPTGTVDETTWNEMARVYGEQRYSGVTVPQGII